MALIAVLVGLGLFCVLLWNFAVYAVPAFVGFSAGFWALNHGAGIGCVVVGLVAGVAIFLIGRIALMNSNPAIRWTVIALFALPAAYAGYNIVLQLSEMGIPSPIWRQVCAAIGGLAVGGTTLTRLIEPAGFASGHRA